MGFSQAIRDEIFVRCARHCCVCHQPKRLNLEIHHIKPRHQGGENTLQNAICLCFDCHADAGHYFADHPKGSKLSPSELLRHKEEWFNIVKENKISEPRTVPAEVSIANSNFSGVFSPVFIKETTTYFDRNFYKEAFEILGMDVKDMINNMKQRALQYDPYIRHHINKINDYEGLIDYFNGNREKDAKEEHFMSCQPVLHRIGPFRLYKEINKSSCVVQLRLTNPGPIVLENYKLKLRLAQVLAADTVNKRMTAYDLGDYAYNVRFFEPSQAEFLPDRDILVQRDSVLLDAICFIPAYRTKFVRLHWELLARNVYHSGHLTVLIEPVYQKESRHQFVENLPIVRTFTQYLPKTIFE